MLLFFKMYYFPQQDSMPFKLLCNVNIRSFSSPTRATSGRPIYSPALVLSGWLVSEVKRLVSNQRFKILCLCLTRSGWIRRLNFCPIETPKRIKLYKTDRILVTQPYMTRSRKSSR